MALDQVVGYPVNLDLKPSIETLDLKHVVDEYNRKCKERQNARKMAEFERVYQLIVNKIRKPKYVYPHLETSLFLKYLDDRDLPNLLKKRLRDDHRISTRIDMSNEYIEGEDTEMCLTSSICCCCIPLPYWCFYFSRKMMYGKTFNITVTFL